jgi:transposase
MIEGFPMADIAEAIRLKLTRKVVEQAIRERVAGTRRRLWDADLAQLYLQITPAGSASYCVRYRRLDVCDVARRHGLAQTQLFTWRREARMKALPESEPELKFAPVVVERAPPPTLAARKRRRGRRGDGGIELEIDGVMVRVGRGAEAKTVAAVIRALKAER